MGRLSQHRYPKQHAYEANPNLGHSTQQVGDVIELNLNEKQQAGAKRSCTVRVGSRRGAVITPDTETDNVSLYTGHWLSHGARAASKLIQYCFTVVSYDLAPRMDRKWVAK